MHQIDNGIKENFFRWDGRLNRLRFLKRLLALFGISIVLYILMGILVLLSGGAAMQLDENTFTGIYGFFTLLCIPITVSSYMLMIRRLHDIGLSGFFILLAFIPIVSLGFLLYVLFKMGTEGDNVYGADPLGTVASAAPTAPAAPENPYARATYADTPTDIAPPKDPQS